MKDNLEFLSPTQNDFDKMRALQSDMIQQIMDSEQLISNLENEINLVKTSTSTTYEGSLATCANIEHITATLEELTVSFQNILVYANLVKANSDELIALQSQ
ncbi:hypothetical protein [Cellulosilyticum ruminicola]|uniref:hypothetical protein n=1 Tax=Cellulosilyticum ruminicola TaxID=425254 RepID=UPI0006D00D2D|nr:hypothetical protein [Cellulosilyticum ruminicola]